MYKLEFKSKAVSKAVALVLASQFFASSVMGQEDDDIDSDRLEKIIVTGQKVDRSIQETATSVDVVTAKELADYNLNDLSDIFIRSANVTTTFGGTGYTIRGITNTNVTGAGIGDLATIYVDGAPMPRDAIQSGPLAVWDVSQVEILKGPQSTLQGRNSLAGAIIINTADPTFEWSGKVGAQYFDENGESRLGVAVGGPLIDDQLAFRLAAEWTDEDGLIFNPTRNEYASAADSTMIRAKLLIEPNSIPDLSVLLSYTNDDRSFGQTFSFLNEPLSSWSDRRIYSNEPNKEETEISVSVLNVSYDLSDDLTLSSVTSYNKVERDRARDGDLTAADLLTNSLEATPKTTTQEFLLNVQKDDWQGVFGLYYSDLDDTNSFGTSRFFVFPERQ